MECASCNSTTTARWDSDETLCATSCVTLGVTLVDTLGVTLGVTLGDTLGAAPCATSWGDPKNEERIDMTLFVQTNIVMKKSGSMHKTSHFIFRNNN